MGMMKTRTGMIAGILTMRRNVAKGKAENSAHAYREAHREAEDAASNRAGLSHLPGMLRGGGAAGAGLFSSAPGTDRRGPAGAGVGRNREVLDVRTWEGYVEG